LSVDNVANRDIDFNGYGIQNLANLEVGSGLVTIDGNVLSGLTSNTSNPSFSTSTVDLSSVNLDYLYWCQDLAGGLPQILTINNVGLKAGQKFTIRNESSAVLTVNTGIGGTIFRTVNPAVSSINIAARTCVQLLCVDNNPLSQTWIVVSTA
jgi:hypothetical protein